MCEVKDKCNPSQKTILLLVIMIGREPTTIQLTSEDLSEINDYLEEYKLKQKLKAQHKSLIKSTKIEPGVDESNEIHQTDSFHSLSLNKKECRSQNRELCINESIYSQGNNVDEQNTSNPFI